MLMENNVNEVKIVCDGNLYETVKASVGDKEGVELFDMQQDGLPALGDNAIVVAIAATSAMLAKTMRKAEARQALLVPILVVDEDKQAESTEPPMLTVEKSRFNSEKELYAFLGRIIDSLQGVDISDFGFIMNEPGRLFFAYAEGESLEIIADKLQDSLKAHDDICAASKAVLAMYSIADADAFDSEKLSSWLKGLHAIFGESCGFIDDVRDGSLKNSSVAMWAKL